MIIVGLLLVVAVDVVLLLLPKKANVPTDTDIDSRTDKGVLLAIEGSRA